MYAVMWSGGKDSLLALKRVRLQGTPVGALLNFHDPATGRVPFHATRVELIEAQAASLTLPLRSIATTWEGFEPAFRLALEALAEDGFNGLVFGDIHLADVRAWYEERVRQAGLEHLEPIWGEDPISLLTEFVVEGGRAVITCCETARLGEEWLGRVLDGRCLAELLGTDVDPCGENGEYHTFAFAGPPLSTPIGWQLGGRLGGGRFLQADLLPAPIPAAWS